MSVHITCALCGREIWQEADDWVTLGDARKAECSDCVMDRALRGRAEILNESATLPPSGNNTPVQP